ncbi:MAG: hypothetical protein GC152_09805 [Alphaproteobacteria bacterium]|nr:hypothetical protein [Alphaproteobacteria bacterium]
MVAFIRTCAAGVAWLLIGLGAVAALIAGAAAWALDKAERSPVDIGFARPFVEWASARAMSGIDVVSIDGIKVSKAPDAGRIEIAFDGVVGLDHAGEEVARFSSVIADFRGADLARGRFGPSELSLADARIRIVRSEARRYALDYGPDGGGRSDVFQTLTGGRFLRGAFERAELQRLRIDFFDEATERAWTARDAAAVIERSAAGYEAKASGSFDVAGASSNMEMTFSIDRVEKKVDARLSVEEAPLGDIVEIFLGPQPVSFTSAVSGVADITLTLDGRTLRSRIDGAAASGVLSWGANSDRRINVRSLALKMAFDAETGPAGTYVVERVEGATSLGDFAASATVSPDLAGGAQFGATVSELFVPSATGESPVQLTNGAIGGTFEPRQRRLELNRIGFDVFGARIDGALMAQAPAGRSLGVTGDIEVVGELAEAEVLRLWPTLAASAAREFVATRVRGARFDGISAAIRLEAGALDEGAAMPDEALELTFAAADAELTYAPGMQPIKGLDGDGVLRGNSFSFVARKGMIEGVTLERGKVSIPILSPKGAPATFEFRAKGDAGDILSILNDPPLQVLKDRPFSVDQFEGVGVVDATIIRPNQADAPRESYDYKATASFDDLVVRDFFRGASLVGARANVALDADGMRIEGGGALNGAALAIDWRQKFAMGGDSTAISVRGEFGPSMADLFGVSIRRYLGGAAPFRIDARGDLGALRTVAIDADFTATSILLDPIDWMKPPGATARLSAQVEFSDDGASQTIISANGADIVVDGRIDLAAEGGVEGVRFNRLQLNEAVDVSVDVSRHRDGALGVIIDGPILSIGGLTKDFIESSNAGEADGDGSERPGPAITLAANVDEFRLRNGIALTGAAFNYAANADGLGLLDFSAGDIDGGRHSALLVSDKVDGRERRRIEADTDNIGMLLSGIFAIESVDGGEGRIEVELSTPHEGDRDVMPTSGRIDARNIRIRNAPLLARIFSAGSLPGLSDLLTGEGIAISDAVARFALAEGSFQVDDFRAAGPSVGLTASGSINFGDGGGVNISGAVAPAYGINSILGNAPLIGDLFVNREGEGLIALSYRVDGPNDRPRVTVNPLSALTPGLLRRMFESDRDERFEALGSISPPATSEVEVKDAAETPR